MIKSLGSAFAPVGTALGALLLFGIVASVALAPFESSLRELLKSMAACPAAPVHLR
jgi:hypothetical protein